MSAPRDNEVEITLFGPGYGECIVAHLGHGKWMIVDSCIDRESGKPAALEYLRNIGVDPAVAVKLIVATHWHDDHVRGLGEVMRICTSAQFACPAALRRPEFFELLKSYDLETRIGSTGVAEFNEVYNELARRSGRNHSVRPRYVLESTLLLDVSEEGQSPVIVMAACPSDAAFENAIVDIAKLVPQTKGDRNRVLSPSPNHSAIVLRVQVGNASILLGSDLEITRDQADGWHRVVTVLEQRPESQLFKVAHHGSQNGHLDTVWSELLSDNAIAVLTPFQRGSVSLPTLSDVERLVALTDFAFITCLPKNMVTTHETKVVNEILESVITSPLVTELPPTGYIRMRYDLARDVSEWDVQAFGRATQLKPEQLRAVARGRGRAA